MGNNMLENFNPQGKLIRRFSRLMPISGVVF